MPLPLLTPWHPRDQLRLFVWLFFEPARFTDYTRNTVKISFLKDLHALFLPESSIPERLLIIHKLSIGVTSPRNYQDDFAQQLQKAFDVPDPQLPEKIMMEYREDAWTGVRERCLLSPAAYAVIRYRRALDMRVQRASGWLGTSIALLPMLVMSTLFELKWLDVRVAALLLACFGVAWVSFGLLFQKEDHLINTLLEDLRELVANGAVGALLVGTFSALMGLPPLHTGLLALAVIVGISYGICALLPVRHPQTLMRATLLTLALAVGIQAVRGALTVLILPTFCLLLPLLTTQAVLRRGLAIGRTLPLHHWVLSALIVAYGVLIVAVLV